MGNWNLQACVLQQKPTKMRVASHKKFLAEYHPIATCMAYWNIESNIQMVLKIIKSCIFLNKFPESKNVLPFKMVRAAPRQRSIYSRIAGDLCSMWMRLQNQIIVAMIRGKNNVFNDTHTLVKPAFWCIATSHISNTRPICWFNFNAVSTGSRKFNK